MQQQTVTQRQFWVRVGVFFFYLVLESVGFYLIPQWIGYRGNLAIFALNNPPPYSASQALAFVNEYGSTGRAAYSVAMVFDILFPFLYATVLSVGLQLVASKMRASNRTQWMVGKFPFIAALANWVADIFILILLTTSTRSSTIALLASVLTSLKFLILGICILGLLFGAIFLLIRKIFRQMRSETSPA